MKKLIFLIVVIILILASVILYKSKMDEYENQFFYLYDSALEVIKIDDNGIIFPKGYFEDYLLPIEEMIDNESDLYKLLNGKRYDLKVSVYEDLKISYLNMTDSNSSDFQKILAYNSLKMLKD